MGTLASGSRHPSFLSSDEAGYITGHVLDVNGGMIFGVGVVMGESKNSETYQIGKKPKRTWPKNWVWMRNRLQPSGSRKAIL